MGERERSALKVVEVVLTQVINQLLFVWVSQERLDLLPENLTAVLN